MAPQVASDGKNARSGDDKRAGAKICVSKLLELVGLPNDLIPLIQEYRYEEDTGFVRMKWKVEHKFKAIGRLVQYYTEISGYVEQQKMKKVSGLKSKELREWITISEISIDDPASAKMKDLREWITISAISIDDPASAKKEVSGVKSKELPEWITTSEISVNGSASPKICFKSDIGNNKSFSVGPPPTTESAIAGMAGMKKGSAMAGMKKGSDSK